MALVTLWHLYPEEMNIYGDRGNVIALTRRLAWRGHEVLVRRLDVGGRLDSRDCHLVFGGGGQDDQQFAVMESLRANGDILRGLAADGVPMLLVCGLYQLFGHVFRTGDGRELAGIGALDLTTTAGRERMIGNVVVEAHVAGQSFTVVGFENHSGQTYLGKGVRPLGRVLRGGGNNGRDGGEGALDHHIVGTYLHGPILPKNPKLADLLLAWALQSVGVSEGLAPLDDRLEARAHDGIVERVMGRRASFGRA